MVNTPVGVENPGLPLDMRDIAICPSASKTRTRCFSIETTRIRGESGFGAVIGVLERDDFGLALAAGATASAKAAAKAAT
jgi:hypothetical protein